jgi:hypothetical protein
VILDEVQTLPRRLIGPLLGMMKELADDWGVKLRLFDGDPAGLSKREGEQYVALEARDLARDVSDPEPLRTALKRAKISWEI